MLWWTLRQFRSGDRGKRETAAKKLVEIGAVKQLELFLLHDDIEVREDAA